MLTTPQARPADLSFMAIVFLLLKSVCEAFEVVGSSNQDIFATRALRSANTLIQKD
mgnify:CR=1 FL=1